jgi:hypothetical protein
VPNQIEERRQARQQAPGPPGLDGAVVLVREPSGVLGGYACNALLTMAFVALSSNASRRIYVDRGYRGYKFRV